MPSTAKRSKWVPKLAAALGWRPQRLRFFFNRRGYKWPYTSELKGLQILVDAGISIAKYRPTEDAVGVMVKGASPSATNGAVVAPTKDSKEARSHWDKKVISRLAAILPEGRTAAGKLRARNILKKHGWVKKPWDDEARALEIFKAEGLSIEGFEYANAPGTPGGAVAAAPPETYEALLVLYNELVERHKKVLAALAERDKAFATLERLLLKEVKDILRQYQHKILNPKRFPELLEPLGYPIEALNAILKYEHPELY